MKEIWKFNIEAPGREQTYDILMPGVAQIIRVGNDPAYPEKGAIHAIVTPNSPVRSRRFHVCGTGWTLPEADHKYIGSWTHEGFIWHVLEIL